jgi:hypothetical protein
VKPTLVHGLVTAAALLAASQVRADDAAPKPDEPTAADVASAPPPGAETGRADPPEHDSLLRDLAQGVLVPPRVAFEVAVAPLRTSVWAIDRYQLVDRWKQLFFDDTYTYGLYPTLVIDASYGFTVGARFVHRNLFGEREHLAVHVGTGGEYRAEVTGGLRTGYRLGRRTQLELGGAYERRPNDAFYGIGNLDDVSETHHRQQMDRALAKLDVRAVDALHVRLAGAFTDLSYAESSDGPPIDMVYDPMTVLTGWSGVRNLYGELELRWDHRRLETVENRYGVFDGGSLFGIYGGRMHQLEAGGDYWQYGADAQHFIRFGGGIHTLTTRVHVEAVTGDYSDVAFTQLPQLGGKMMLRGYPRDRFRDRVAALGSAEYGWDAGRYVIASIFTDVGRVYPSWQDFTVDHMRVGFGTSLQLHDQRTFLACVSLATSIDGGVFLNLAFDPIVYIEPRVEER